ncbi:MAG: isochorismate synthase, partial [Bacillaceae bacterium]
MKMNTMHFASAEQILSEYQEGASFFMASPTRTLLTKGIVQTVPTTGYR